MAWHLVIGQQHMAVIDKGFRRWLRAGLGHYVVTPHFSKHRIRNANAANHQDVRMTQQHILNFDRVDIEAALHEHFFASAH
ncbi:hypothetical protein AWV79_21600 [Cupriavidus sp. UYMMa02A]|nr:hypothetical protein AWV79_21600 [Cupriavidus sp. UYMMa02A]